MCVEISVFGNRKLFSKRFKNEYITKMFLNGIGSNLHFPNTILFLNLWLELLPMSCDFVVPHFDLCIIVFVDCVCVP